MISTKELLTQAQAYDLNQADVQRDYLFGWLISGIFTQSELGSHVVLKGGNALRKGYFPGTRFSDDLDLTSEQGIDSDHLLSEMNAVCHFAGIQTGVRFDIDRNRIVGEQMVDQTKRVIKLRLYFKDFIGQQDHVTLSIRMDVSEFDRLYLPPQYRQLLHPYSDADVCRATIRCVKLEEALADKMKCLLQRRYCYDLFDLVYGAFLSDEIEVNRAEILQVFLRKTIFGGSPYSARALLLDLPVDLFRGYWGKVVMPKAKRISFDAALEHLRTGIDEMFGVIPGQAAAVSHAFYPSRLRNPILQAGSERRLLRVTYDGVSRLVEPYSLSYKRRTDGVAQEYLYGWDRTGGRRSGPGIKTFINSKVQQLELTDETFQPRFAVELSKAGDSNRVGYFARPAGRPASVARGIARPRARADGLIYIVACSYCGKEFRRTKNSTRMNKHVNQVGSPCFGRTGYLVRTTY